MLATVICLGDSSHINIESRLETLFDIMDFSNNGQVSADELVSWQMYTSALEG